MVQVPGDYGLYLLSLLGKQHWAEDFGSPCYVRFESLWVRLRGKWLYPVHSFLPDTPPPLAPAYGKHLDVRWGQLSAFVRRRVAATKPEPLGEDAVVLVQRRDSRLLHDSEHRSYDRLLHVLGEGGINLKPVRRRQLRGRTYTWCRSLGKLRRLTAVRAWMMSGAGEPGGAERGGTAGGGDAGQGAGGRARRRAHQHDVAAARHLHRHRDRV